MDHPARRPAIRKSGRLVFTRMSCIRLRALACVSILFAVAPLAAHDYWLDLSSWAPGAGETVVVTHLVGERLAGETVGRNPAAIVRFEAVAADGASRPVVLEALAHRAGRFLANGSGTTRIVYQSLPAFATLSPATFERYIDEERLDPIRELRGKLGESDRPAREAFSRSAIAVACGPGKGSPMPTPLRATGLELEIVPESDPCDAAPGRELAFRLLRDGRPVTGVVMRALARGRPDPPLESIVRRRGPLPVSIRRRGTLVDQGGRNGASGGTRRGRMAESLGLADVRARCGRRVSRFRFSSLLVLLGGLLVVAAPAESAGAEDVGERPALPAPGEMARVKALIEAGQLEAARSRLEPIVRDHPDWGRATLLLGVVELRENRFERARVLLERAAALDPDELSGRLFLGWCLFYLGELGPAERSIRSFLEGAPGHAEGWYALGRIAFRRRSADRSPRRARAEPGPRRELERPPRRGARSGPAWGAPRPARRPAGGAARARSRHGAVARLPRSLASAVASSRTFRPRRRGRGGANSRRCARGHGGDRSMAGMKAIAAVAAVVAFAGSLLGGARPAPAEIRFTDVSRSAGVELVMTSGRMPSREILEVNGGGVALFDYDRDGDLDLFLANGATMEAPERGPGSRLYANRGDGRFDDVTTASGIALHGWMTGVAVGDVDGDGWDDLFVAGYRDDVLLRNEAAPGGGRRFVDATPPPESATRTGRRARRSAISTVTAISTCSSRTISPSIRRTLRRAIGCATAACR